jgi:transposase-like protein
MKRKNKAYSQEQIEQVIELRKNQGLSYAHIGKKMNIPVGTVRGWVIRNETKVKNQKTEMKEVTRNEYSDDFKNQIIQEILNTGRPVKEVALKHGLKYHRVYEWYRKHSKGHRNAKSVARKTKTIAKLANMNKRVDHVSDILESTRPKVAKNKEMEMLKARNEYLKKIINLHDIKVD